MDIIADFSVESIKINEGAIKNILNQANQGLYHATVAVKNDILKSKVVPKDTGALEKSVKVIKGLNEDKITFSRVYALRLYYHPEYRFSKKKNPQAQGLWMNEYISGSKKDMATHFVRDYMAKKL